MSRAPLLSLLSLVCACRFNTEGLVPPEADVAIDAAGRDTRADAPSDRGAPDRAAEARVDLAPHPDGVPLVDLPPFDTKPAADSKLDSKPAPDAKPAPDTKPPPDTRPPDSKPPDTRPPDSKPAPDTKPPCSGVSCPLGCNPSLNRCNRLLPSSFDPKSFHDSLSGAVAISGSGEIDTTTGRVRVGGIDLRPAGSPGTTQNGIYFGVVSQPAPHPGLAVIGVASLTVSATAVLQIVGTHALAIYSVGDVLVAGTIAASGNGATPVAGGFAGGAANTSAPGCSGGGGKTGTTINCSGYLCKSGGGGGGRKASGGKGGATTTTALNPGGLPGVAVGDPSLVPLSGGCGGAGGAHSCSAMGGAGGGAFQLSSGSAILVTGTITMPGEGGRGSGAASNGGFCAGGGGGSGGAILLEAASLSFTGTAILAANGGGGGGSGSGGGAGGRGLSATTSAPGGSVGAYGATGGAGGALTVESGYTPLNGSYQGAGGGGAAGRIRLNAASPISLSIGTKISPAASQNQPVPTW